APATLKDELDQGARPYWVHIKKDDVVNFTTANVNGRIVIDRLTIQESIDQSDGQFGVKQTTQWRVLRRSPEGATWELWQMRKNKAVIISPPQLFLGAGGKPFLDIPI